MDILSHINLIRREIGLKEILPASDGVCGFLSEKEVAYYIGKKNARVLFKEHNKRLKQKYLKGPIDILQPVMIGDREGIVVEMSYDRYMTYTVLVGCRYEIEIVGPNECRKRVAKVGEMDLYKEFSEREERILKKVGFSIGVGSCFEVGGSEHEYLGLYKKKIVMRKKEGGDIMYYNVEEVFS